MTMQLQDQLRVYAEYVDEQAQPIEVAAVIGESPHTPVVGMGHPAARRPRRLSVAFIVAAAITAAVLVPLIFLRGDAETDVATTLPNTTSASPTTTAETTPTTVRVFAVGNQVSDLPSWTDTGWRWVPTGLRVTVNGRLADGRWVAFDNGWDCFEDGRYFVTESARHFVGSDVACTEGEPIEDPTEILYTSIDGVNWEATVLTQFAGYAAPRDLHGIHDAQGGSSLFVSAWPIGTESGPSEETHWVSTDGRQWDPIVINVPEGFVDDPGFQPNAHLIGYQGVRSGATIVAPTNCPTSGFVTVSQDAGRSFTIVDAIPGAATTSQTRPCSRVRTQGHELFTIGGVFHALSYPTDVDEPQLWRSADGFDWQLVGTASGLEPWGKRRPIGTNPPVDLGTAALGVRGNGGFDARRSYVISSDGLTWTDIEVPQCGSQRHDAWLRFAERTTDNTGWVMLTPCDLGGTEQILGHHTANGLTWYHVDRPEAAPEADVFYEENVVMAWDTTLGSSLWLAVPPE